MILWGCFMWWQRRAGRGRRGLGKPPRRGALRRAPWWGAAVVLLSAVGVGRVLPLMGMSPAAFMVIDAVIGGVRRA